MPSRRIARINCARLTHKPGTELEHALLWAMKPIFYSRHPLPPDIIRHAVWFYVRFTLSSHDVENLLAECGRIVSNESIHRRRLKFGPVIARNLRKSLRKVTGSGTGPKSLL